MGRVTIAEAARACGLNRSTVSRQARTWGLVGDDGLLDLADYMRERETALDVAKSHHLEHAGLAEARARKAAADAALAEMSLARQRGELLPAAEVQAAATRVFQDALARLDADWAEVAVAAARETDPGRIEDLIRLALRARLAGLSKEFLNEAARRAE